MFEITRHLSYSDIELLNYNKNKKQNEKDITQEKDIGGKERQE